MSNFGIFFEALLIAAVRLPAPYTSLDFGDVLRRLFIPFRAFWQYGELSPDFLPGLTWR